MSVTQFIRDYPILLNLHDMYTWNTSDVGDEFAYPQSVHFGELYAYNGVVMEMFMRKCICRKYGISCRDDRTEEQLRCSQFKEITLKERLFEAYQDYCNPALEAIDIVEQIKIVALSHRLAHCEEMENVRDATSMEIDPSNLISIMKYVDGLQYNRVSCQPHCDLAIADVNFSGVPDYIFDDAVICQVGTSMRDKAHRHKTTKTILYMLAHYCGCYYSQNITKLYTIIIYNPLLGIEHKLEITIRPEDFNLILNVLRNWLKMSQKH